MSIFVSCFISLLGFRSTRNIISLFLLHQRSVHIPVQAISVLYSYSNRMTAAALVSFCLCTNSLGFDPYNPLLQSFSTRIMDNKITFSLVEKVKIMIFYAMLYIFSKLRVFFLRRLKGWVGLNALMIYLFFRNV